MFLVAWTLPSLAPADGASGTRPLRVVRPENVRTILPGDTHLLTEVSAIERLLDLLEGHPPDWQALYGRGHDDEGLDERLFQFNRARDAAREGRETLRWRMSFIWAGELTRFDPRTGGFRVGIGPTFTPTRWGIIRFKPEDLPGNLTAVPDPQHRKTLRRRFEKGERFEVWVVMTGRLIPEESIVYDFSHDDQGQGVIMPVVRVEQVDFVLPFEPQ